MTSAVSAMGPDDFLLMIMLTALTLYGILGGADFGAGVWEFTTALQSTERERAHIYKAIGPVWEANHVWLIFVLVILLNGFPKAYALLGKTLWLPLLLVLCGIVFRGASYVFRSYGHGAKRERLTWEWVFAVASTATPFFLGASAGAVAAGSLGTMASESPSHDLTGWMSSLSLFTGFYAVGMCAYLAAVYLTREAVVAGDEHLVQIWRQRAMSTGLWVGVLSFAGLVMISIEAPQLANAFKARGWPFVLISLCCGLGSLYELWRHRASRAVLAAMGAVAAVLWGWGVSQYPVLIPPTLTGADAQAPDNVLWWMLAVIVTGTLLLFPALGYLFYLFKSTGSGTAAVRDP